MPEPIELFLAQFDVNGTWSALFQPLPHQLNVSKPAIGCLHQTDDLLCVCELLVGSNQCVSLEETHVVSHHRFLEVHLHDGH
jgi:hypothetical protein